MDLSRANTLIPIKKNILTFFLSNYNIVQSFYAIMVLVCIRHLFYIMKTATLLLMQFFYQPLFAYAPNDGEIAPDFQITQIDGSSFKLSDFKGKQSVYVVFFNTWCHYCMKKIPKLKAAQNNLNKDIRIIAINTSRDDSVAETKGFIKKFDINYSLAFDHNERITDLYNVHGVPTEFIIDINGRIVHRDGVPERLADYVNQWNEKTDSITQTIQSYLRIVQTILNDMQIES